MASRPALLVYGNPFLYPHYFTDSMKYLLLGLGISNQAVEKYFIDHNIDYVSYDDEVNKTQVNLSDIDVIVKSPGIHPSHSLLSNNIIKVTDLELFYQFTRDVNFITVTGSNGKTTTVSLIHHLTEDTNLGGNVGKPLFDFINSACDTIIEASSFMLEHTHQFRSKYSVLLNLYPTHLDHHGTYALYVKSKLKLIQNVLPSDYIIYNYDDVLLRRLVAEKNAIKIPFSCKEKVGVYYENEAIWYRGQKILNTKDLPLLGKHNIQNAMAAIAVVLHYKGDISKIKSFRPVHFRLEYLTSLGNVKIYNDSKSTNYLATLNALRSFPNKKVCLIAGGMKRIDDFRLFDEITNIDRIYLFGESRVDFMEYFCKRIKKICIFETLEEVMKNVNIEDCDVLLFSPGCVSYDQFDSYIVRGKEFNRFVFQHLIQPLSKDYEPSS